MYESLSKLNPCAIKFMLNFILRPTVWQKIWNLFISVMNLDFFRNLLLWKRGGYSVNLVDIFMKLVWIFLETLISLINNFCILIKLMFGYFLFLSKFLYLWRVFVLISVNKPVLWIQTMFFFVKLEERGRDGMLMLKFSGWKKILLRLMFSGWKNNCWCIFWLKTYCWGTQIRMLKPKKLRIVV